MKKDTRSWHFWDTLKKKKTDITISIYPTKYPVIMIFGTPQTEIACSELTKETLEQGVKCI